MSGNRIDADPGSGFRNNPADFEAGATFAQRGSFGAEQNPGAKAGGGAMVSSALPGNPHSSSGFRRAIKSAGRSGSSLKDKLPNKTTFGGKGFKKPNYFAQGGKRHGLHISTGAPHTSGATQEGSEFGGN